MALWAGLMGLMMGDLVWADVGSLERIDYLVLPGNRVQLRLFFDREMAEPTAFNTDQPARVVMDFPDTVSHLASKSQNIGVGLVQNVMAVEGNGRTRVVVSLAASTPYQLRPRGRTIEVSFNGPGGAEGNIGPVARKTAAPARRAKADKADKALQAASYQVPPASMMAPASPEGAGPVALVAGQVNDVAFHRGTAGEGRVVIRLGDPRAVVNMTKEGEKIVAEVKGQSLPEALWRRLDVTDFGTPVYRIDARQVGENTRVEIEAKQPNDFMTYQVDTDYTLEFRPLTRDEEENLKRKNKEYSGERVSFNFQKIEIRRLLTVMADFMKLNLVMSDTVAGDISLRLDNVPVDQALELILKTRGLASRREGNILRIGPLVELSRQEEIEAEAHKRFEEIEPLQVEFLQLNYVKAETLRDLLMTGIKNVTEKTETSSTAGGASTLGTSGSANLGGVSGDRNLSFNAPGQVGASSAREAAYSFKRQNSMLSDRGSILADARTNLLWIRDTPTRLREIRAFIAKIDIPQRQVLIESRVVIANTNFARDLGVRFGFSRANSIDRQNEINIGGILPGGVPGSNTINKGTFMQDVNGNAFSAGYAVGGAEGLMVNLPAAAPTSGVQFLIGKVGSYLLQLELSAMQQEGRGEVVSSPKVITTDNEPATIKAGTEIPYQAATSSGATSVSFKEAVLQLDVTPQITPDEKLILELNVKKDNPDWSRSVLGTPPIDKR
ncbi:MAG: type IV pilus secretin PilQ, partial [Pseudomonadota bacterium]